MERLVLERFQSLFFSLFKAFIPKKKIRFNLDDLENFIQTKSAWVSQVTLYGYLKTRMGTRYVLHFENDEFMICKFSQMEYLCCCTSRSYIFHIFIFKSKF